MRSEVWLNQHALILPFTDYVEILVASRILNLARSFVRNDAGNVAMMTSVALLVIVGAIAMALDMSKGINNKSRLADATDAVALVLAKSGLDNQSDLERLATNYLTEHYPGEAGTYLKILSITKDGDAVTVQMINESENSFGAFLGDETEDISVSATAVWSQRALDMVLVLDTTLSMEGSRLTSLKTAAADMVDVIEGFNNEDFRISVVPFSNYVNVGMSNRYQSWMSVPLDSSSTTNVCRMKRDVTSTSNCRTVSGTYDRDGVSTPYSRQQCDHTYGPEYEECGPSTSTQKWYGCVGSRDEPYDTRVDFNGRKFPGLLNIRCGAEVLPMTSNLTSVRSRISSLNAIGNTYMPAGLMWGWRTLTSDHPFRHTAEPKAQKVMVLMTDGDNTRSKNGDSHEGGDTADANSKTTAICEAIKDEDILVYTIAYEVKDSATKSLLRDCATTRAFYFNARNASELNKAFEDIANSLTELRISA